MIFSQWMWLNGLSSIAISRIYQHDEFLFAVKFLLLIPSFRTLPVVNFFLLCNFFENVRATGTSISWLHTFKCVRIGISKEICGRSVLFLLNFALLFIFALWWTTRVIHPQKQTKHAQIQSKRKENFTLNINSRPFCLACAFFFWLKLGKINNSCIESTIAW